MNKLDFKKLKNSTSATLTLVSPKMSDELLLSNIKNRDPKMKKILTLVQAMVDDKFSHTGDTIKIDRDDKVIDGQNRLMSVSKSGISQPFLIVRGLDPECAKNVDVGSKRQLKDWLQFLQVENSTIIAPSLRALDAYYVENAPKRIGQSLNKYEIPIDRSLELFNVIRVNLEKSAQWAKSNKQSNSLSPSQTATAMHVLSEIDEDLAETFFNELCCGIKVDAGSPTMMLRDCLRKTKEEAKCGARASLRASQVYKLIITAWNYWVQDYTMPKAVFDKNSDFPLPVNPN